MSVQQPWGDLSGNRTSPSTLMNNTHLGVVATGQHHPQQLLPDPGLDVNFKSSLLDSNQQLNCMLPLPTHSGVHGIATTAAAGSSVVEFNRQGLDSVGDLHVGDLLHSEQDGLVSHPLMLPAADSLLSQGSTDLCGLGEGFGMDDGQQHNSGSFGTAAAATRISIDMQDVLNTDMDFPGIHAGSPQLHSGSHSPGLSHFGGNVHTSSIAAVHESYTADSLKHQQPNGSQVYGNLVPQQVPQQYKQHTSQQPAAGSQRQQQQHHHQRHSAAQQRQQYASSSRTGSNVASTAAGAGGASDVPAQPVFRSQYRGVSYDKKKRKWRVQIKVAALGKSGVSVGYFDTEDAAARAYDRAAIGLLGRQNCKAVLNFPIEEYDHDSVPELVGKSREEVKATLKSERAKMPRRRLTHRRRTSRFLGVGSSNRKNQWQARILYHGKVTHLGYYRTEEEAARVYDKVSISLHGAGAQTNFPIDQYKHEVGSLQQKLSGLTREELQRALGVKPMDKSSRYRGVSKKKGRWEAKVLLNRKWAYREMFDSESDAARAYDTALWRLKPREAASYVNFKDTCPTDVAEALAALEKDVPLATHPTGLPMTALPLIDAGLLFDDEGQSIRAPNGLTRTVSIGDLVSVNDSAGQSISEEPSAGNGSAGRPHLSGDAASGGATGAVAGATEGVSSLTQPTAAAGTFGLAAHNGMLKSASYSALSALDGAVTSGLACGSAADPAAAAAAPVPLNSLPASARGALRGELTHVHLQPLQADDSPFPQQQQQHPGSSFVTPSGGLGGMPRVHSVPQLRTYGSDSESPALQSLTAGETGSAGYGNAGAVGGLHGYNSCGAFSTHQEQQQQQQWMGGMPFQQQHQLPASAFAQSAMQSCVPVKLENTYWSPEVPYQLPQHTAYQQTSQQPLGGMRASRSCGNLAFMGNSPSGMNMGMTQQGSGMLQCGHGGNPSVGAVSQNYGSNSPNGGAHGGDGSCGVTPSAEHKPLMVRVGSEQHLLNPNPVPHKGLVRIASDSHLSAMVPLSPGQQFLGPERDLLSQPDASCGVIRGSGCFQQQQQHSMAGYNGQLGVLQYGQVPAAHHQQLTDQQLYAMDNNSQSTGTYAVSSSMASVGAYAPHQQQGMQQLQPGSLQLNMGGPGSNSSLGIPPLSPASQQQQQQQAVNGNAAGGLCSRAFRSSSAGGMHRAHSCAALQSIDETSVLRHQAFAVNGDDSGLSAGRGHSLPGTLGAPVPMNGTPVSCSGMYMLQQQQQQQQAATTMLPVTGGFSITSPAGHLPPTSTALPVPQQQQQQNYMHNSFGTPSAAVPQNGGSSSGGGGFGAPSMSTSAAAGSAAAAAAAFSSMSGASDQWGTMGASAVPGSPLGAVQIGGEELDVAMAFLTDGSPRHLAADGDLDINGLLTEPTAHHESPLHRSSDLLFGNAAVPVGERMDE